MSEQEQRRIFSQNLRRLIEEREKNQREVADAIGVSPQTFNTWCQGIALPRMSKVEALAQYFRIRKSDLLEERVLEDRYNVDSARLLMQIKNDSRLMDLCKDYFLLPIEQRETIFNLIHSMIRTK